MARSSTRAAGGELPVPRGGPVVERLREGPRAAQPLRRPPVQYGFQAGRAHPQMGAEDLPEERVEAVPGVPEVLDEGVPAMQVEPGMPSASVRSVSAFASSGQNRSRTLTRRRRSWVSGVCRLSTSASRKSATAVRSASNRFRYASGSGLSRAASAQPQACSPTPGCAPRAPPRRPPGPEGRAGPAVRTLPRA